MHSTENVQGESSVNSAETILPSGYYDAENRLRFLRGQVKRGKLCGASPLWTLSKIGFLNRIGLTNSITF